MHTIPHLCTIHAISRALIDWYRVNILRIHWHTQCSHIIHVHVNIWQCNQTHSTIYHKHFPTIHNHHLCVKWTTFLVLIIKLTLTVMSIVTCMLFQKLIATVMQQLLQITIQRTINHCLSKILTIMIFTYWVMRNDHSYSNWKVCVGTMILIRLIYWMTMITVISFILNKLNQRLQNMYMIVKITTWIKITFIVIIVLGIIVQIMTGNLIRTIIMSSSKLMKGKQIKCNAIHLLREKVNQKHLQQTQHYAMLTTHPLYASNKLSSGHNQLNEITMLIWNSSCELIIRCVSRNRNKCSSASCTLSSKSKM